MDEDVYQDSLKRIDPEERKFTEEHQTKFDRAQDEEDRILSKTMRGCGKRRRENRHERRNVKTCLINMINRITGTPSD